MADGEEGEEGEEEEEKRLVDLRRSSLMASPQVKIIKMCYKCRHKLLVAKIHHVLKIKYLGVVNLRHVGL